METLVSPTTKEEQAPNYDSLIQEEMSIHGSDYGQLLIALNNMFGYPEGAKLLNDYLKKQAFHN